MLKQASILLFFLCPLTAFGQRFLWQPQIPPPSYISDTLTLTVIGDVMMHEKQLNHDYDNFLRRIKPALEEADLAVANMEFTLAGKPYSGYPCFSAPDSYSSCIARSGIDIFLCANNHILDKGSSGLERTIGRYRSMSDSIVFTGIAMSEDELTGNYPLILIKNGISIAIINFTYGTNAGSQSEWPAVNRMSKEKISAAIKRAKKRKVDFILAMPHWGTEYQLIHDSNQEEMANWLVEQGVDAIVGAHPHVVQDTTHIDNVPVIYSLGNAISNMSAPNTRLELAVTFRFIKIGPKCVLEDPQLRFMWCTLPGMLTNGYATVFVDEYKDKKSEWLVPSDYDNMMKTQQRVVEQTGIELK